MTSHTVILHDKEVDLRGIEKGVEGYLRLGGGARSVIL